MIKAIAIGAKKVKGKGMVYMMTEGEEITGMAVTPQYAVELGVRLVETADTAEAMVEHGHGLVIPARY